MSRTIMGCILAYLAAGCTGAGENVFDSSKAVNCMAIFGISHNAYQQLSNFRDAELMNVRNTFLAKQNGGPNWIKDNLEEAVQIGAKISAKNDREATIRLLKGCEASQYGDPEFRALTKR